MSTCGKPHVKSSREDAVPSDDTNYGCGPNAWGVLFLEIHERKRFALPSNPNRKRPESSTLSGRFETHTTGANIPYDRFVGKRKPEYAIHHRMPHEPIVAPDTDYCCTAQQPAQDPCEAPCVNHNAP